MNYMHKCVCDSLMHFLISLILGQRHLYNTTAQMGFQHVGESGVLQNQEDPDRIYPPHRVNKAAHCRPVFSFAYSTNRGRDSNCSFSRKLEITEIL